MKTTAVNPAFRASRAIAAQACLASQGHLRFRSLVRCGGVTRPHPGDILKITQHLCASQRMIVCFAPCRASIQSPAAWQAAAVSVFSAAPRESNPGEVVRRLLATDSAVPPSTRTGRLRIKSSRLKHPLLALTVKVSLQLRGHLFHS